MRCVALPTFAIATTREYEILCALSQVCLVFCGTLFAYCEQQVKVRIRATPKEREIDGVRLDRFERGSVKEVSPNVGAWLIAAGYAEPEMRSTPGTDDPEISGLRRPRDAARDRHLHRRRTDR